MSYYSSYDRPSYIRVSDAAATEGGALRFTVYRTGDTSRYESMSVRTQLASSVPYGSKANAFDDYVGNNQRIYWRPGQTSQTFFVQSRDDLISEGTEYFDVVTYNGSNYNMRLGYKGTGTIYDNDPSYPVTYPTPVVQPAPVVAPTNVNTGVQNIGGVVQNSNNTTNTTNINSGNTINSNNTTTITETTVNVVGNTFGSPGKMFGPGRDVLTGQSDVNYRLMGGDDDISIIGGINDVNGNMGSDRIAINGGRGRYLGGRDNDSISVFSAENGTTVNGNRGDDLITGSAANVVYRGGKDNDTFRVSAGTLYGDLGADLFQATAGAGVAVIQNFDTGLDRIGSIAGGSFTQTAQGLVYGVGSDQMLLLSGITNASQVVLV